MSLYIQTNISALQAEENFNETQTQMQASFTKLSSGYRINSAADDAAGLGIAKSMNAQVQSYAVAAQNANNAVSMVQTADSAADQIDSLLTRMRQLAVEAQNGTMNSTDVSNLDTEFQQDMSEIDRVAADTSFNGTNLLSSVTSGSGTAATFSGFSVTFQVGINGSANDTISVAFGGADVSGLNLGGATVTSANGGANILSAIDTAMQNLNTQRAGFGAAMNRLQDASSNNVSTQTNLSSALSTIQDVDVAAETANLAREQVLAQAGASVLSQANQAPQLALKLLGQ
jgi:flagellin